MHVALVNPILASPNIRPGLILEEARPIQPQELGEINIVELGKALADRGNRVTVYAADAFLEDGDVRMGDRLVVRSIPTRLRRFFHPALLPLSPDLPRALIGDGPDVIQSSEFHNPGTYLASRAAASSGAPLIVWQEVYHRMRSPGSWYQLGYEVTAGRYVRRSAARFVPRTSKAKDFLLRLRVAADQIAPWVPSGVDLEVFRPRPSKPFVPGLSGTSHWILVVARLSADKRVDLAIRSFALLRAAGEDVGLAICGSGPNQPVLKALADELGVGERVVFFQRMPREDLVSLYSAADVFLVTSRGDLELMPFAVIQAAACGLPVVTVRTGAVLDVVQHGETGIVADDESPHGIVQALRVLLADDALRKTIGHQARQRAEALFDVRVVARNLEGVYRASLESN